MEVTVQLKTADGSVGSSLGYESAVSSVVKDAGLRLYPRYPGTQDSQRATQFRVPVSDRETADRVVGLLSGHDGVQSVAVGR